MKDINCIKVSENYLFARENDGDIHMYNIETGAELKTLNAPQINSPVSSIENKGNEYLLTGHDEGTLNLFDIKKGKGSLIHSLNEIHTSKIVALKFESIEKHDFTFISSDEDGIVMNVFFSSKFKNIKKSSE